MGVLLLGLLLVSAPGFVVSLDGLYRWGWDWLFGSVAVLWPVLLIVYSLVR